MLRTMDVVNLILKFIHGFISQLKHKSPIYCIQINKVNVALGSLKINTAEPYSISLVAAKLNLACFIHGSGQQVFLKTSPVYCACNPCICSSIMINLTNRLHDEIGKLDTCEFSFWQSHWTAGQEMSCSTFQPLGEKDSRERLKTDMPVLGTTALFSIQTNILFSFSRLVVLGGQSGQDSLQR